MTTTVARIKSATIKFGTSGAEDASGQYINVVIAVDTSVDGGDLKALDGTGIPGTLTETWALTGSLIEDWTATDGGFYKWALDNAGTSVEFEVIDTTPTTGTGAKWVGTVQVAALSANVGPIDATTPQDVSWNIVGRPTYTPPAPPAAP